MADTPNLKLPKLAEGQASAEIRHNDALNLLDSLSHMALKSRSVATPPGSPAEGDGYLIASSPTGVWTGLDGKLVFYYGGGWVPGTGGTPTGISPREGMKAWIMDEDRIILFDGSAWINAPFYAENLSSAPASSSANKGRIIFNTSSGKLQVDTGSSFETITST